ncbi:AtpZ/AtpI family protein [Raineya orbicola]|jgi:F0F1-type ATP synthase assembly protein I|uniref:Putative F0F1-ATPase subunit n=1 Tax=Raineya orbicola TaxID=2016530 RepID=A0A2N3IJF5_9BACT|nr:AtpZ/AtpI family protein [Raineya orbicola]PKQ70388.1 putative F0F1-ATPase subunit [Raineya orbicola]
MNFFKFNSKEKKDLEGYAKYSGIAFQMIATIGLAVWAGLYLDEKQSLSQPYWTIGLTTMAVIVSIISVVKNFLPKK